MWYVLIINAFLVLLLFITISTTLMSKKLDERCHGPIIHSSGIYSIVRKTPRENIMKSKKSLEDISQYLANKNTDINGNILSKDDKGILLEMWTRGIEESISEVEEGDKQGIEFYYYDFIKDDPVCAKFITKGEFVSREEIYKFPQVIPPFHLGCRCKLKGYHGSSVDILETTEMSMHPFFTDKNLPPMPLWKDIVKFS